MFDWELRVLLKKHVQLAEVDAALILDWIHAVLWLLIKNYIGRWQGLSQAEHNKGEHKETT